MNINKCLTKKIDQKNVMLIKIKDLDLVNTAQIVALQIKIQFG